MKIREMHFVFLLNGVMALLFAFQLGIPYRAWSQTPAGPAAQKPPPTHTLSTGAGQAGQAQPQKGSAPFGELDQRFQALNRELEGTEKKIEEFSKLVAQERSRLPSESVLLDQYLFLQSQVQELSTKVEQLQSQPRVAAQRTTPSAAPPQPKETSSFSLFSALLPIFVVLLYDRFFNARRFPPLEERIEQLEDYGYSKDMEERDPFKETEKKEEV
jgi:hypothetical protein